MSDKTKDRLIGAFLFALLSLALVLGLTSVGFAVYSLIIGDFSGAAVMSICSAVWLFITFYVGSDFV